MTQPPRPANEAQKHRAGCDRQRHDASSRRSLDATDEARVAMDLVVRNARLHPTAGTHPEPVDGRRAKVDGPVKRGLCRES
jgi:hypothetical protein